VLFTDIVGSTELAARLGDRDWRRLLERHDEISAAEVHAAGGRMVKHTGDGLLASFDGPARAVRCAARLVDRLREHDIEIRAGVHTGECELRGEDIGGLAVHIGARVAAKASAGEVLVSSTVRDLVVGSELRFSERGQHELKGVPGTWMIFALGQDAPATAPIAPHGQALRRSDRATMRAMRRAPGAFRLGARLVGRSA
jgi:class 3 adenylate cyclase